MKRLLTCLVCLCIAPLGGCGDDPITPPPLTPIQGRIEDTDGQPVPGVIVLVGDKSAVTSDTEGSFRVEQVGSSYDVALLFDSTEARFYSGITRRDPFFRVAPRTATTRTARIMGVVPTVPSKTTMVAFAPNNLTGMGTIADAKTGAFTLHLFWTTSRTSLEGTMCVIRWTVGADGLPAEYDAFGKLDLVLAEGTTTIQDLAPAALSDPPEAPISGSMAIPSGYRFNGVRTLMQIGKASFLVCWAGSANGPRFIRVHAAPRPRCRFLSRGQRLLGVHAHDAAQEWHHAADFGDRSRAAGVTANRRTSSRRDQRGRLDITAMVR